MFGLEQKLHSCLAVSRLLTRCVDVVIRPLQYAVHTEHVSVSNTPTSDHHGGGLLYMVILVLAGHSHASFVKHRRTLCKLTRFPYR